MIRPFYLVLSAPSGAGKTTIVHELLSNHDEFAFSVSTTTRPIREGEKEGESYYFVSRNTFKRMIEAEDFVEWACVHENYYGTSKKEIDRILAEEKIPVLDIDVQGAEQIKHQDSDAVFIFIVPPSFESLEQRLRQRNTDSEEQIKTRLHNALAELEHYTMYDYIIINDSLSEAVDRLKCIIKAEMCRKERYLEIPLLKGLKNLK